MRHSIKPSLSESNLRVDRDSDGDMKARVKEHQVTAVVSNHFCFVNVL